MCVGGMGYGVWGMCVGGGGVSVCRGIVQCIHVCVCVCVEGRGMGYVCGGIENVCTCMYLEPTIFNININMHVHVHVVRTDRLVLRVCWLECCRDTSALYPYQDALES